jgi:hypothetical protein
MSRTITITKGDLAQKIEQASEGFIPSITKKVQKVKISKTGGVDVEFETIATILDPVNGKPIDLYSDDVKKGKFFAHQDLIDALNMLRSHLTFICDLPEAREITLHDLEDLNEELLEKIHVTGISLGGDGEHEGVSIIGYKVLGSGKVLNLVAPFTKYFDENDAYLYSDELRHTCHHIANEALLYIDGKYAPSAQTEIDFEAGDIEEEDTVF